MAPKDIAYRNRGILRSQGSGSQRAVKELAPSGPHRGPSEVANSWASP